MALPSFKVLTLTDAAANRVKDIIARSDRPIVGVRVGVKNGGCAGMSYTMEYAESINPLDEVVEDKGVKVDMTLTTPNCPSAQELPLMVENAVASVPGVREVKVEVVWDPPWDQSRMSDEARVVLNMW